MHLDWLAASPFCLVATAGADGTCDLSPKGDPPEELARYYGPSYAERLYRELP